MLDNLGYIRKLDKSDMLALLDGFPQQIKDALDIGAAFSAPGGKEFSNIVFTGLGGSAIGGDVARCCLADELGVPFVVNRDYLLPGFVGPKTLLFASSYSGNTEETISAYKEAKKKGARIIVITGGGELARLAAADGFPLISIPGGMPPRCALGYSFVPVIIAVSKMGLVKDKTDQISEAVRVLSGLRDDLIGPGVKAAANLAKKTASVLAGRFSAVYGWSKNLDCAVTRWRNQFCENSKALATSHFLPEMDHNEIMGFSHPKGMLKDTVVVFLRDKGDHSRVRDRIEITSSIIKDRVYKVLEVESAGSGITARICSLIYIGDFVSFYLAILNKEDPTPVDEITYLKNELAKR